MDRQTIFDTVAQHLLAQNKRSVGGDGDSCLYRGNDGTK